LDGQGLRQLQQVVQVGRPGRAGLLHQRSEHPLVARQRAGVRSGGRCSGHRLADLQHRHAHASLGAVGERLAQQGSVAVALQVQRDRADLVVAGQRAHPLGGVHDRRVPARHHRVEAQRPAPGQRVHGEVAALRHHRDRSGHERREGVAPHGRPGRDRDDSVPVRPADGKPVPFGHLAQLALVLDAPRDLAEPRAIDDCSAAAELAGLVEGLRHGRGGDSHNDGVRRLRKLRQRREALVAVRLLAGRVHAPDGSGKAGPAQVQERLARVRAVPLARP
jgi:hypothetical protein